MTTKPCKRFASPHCIHQVFKALLSEYLTHCECGKNGGWSVWPPRPPPFLFNLPGDNFRQPAEIRPLDPPSHPLCVTQRPLEETGEDKKELLRPPVISIRALTLWANCQWSLFAMRRPNIGS